MWELNYFLRTYVQFSFWKSGTVCSMLFDQWVVLCSCDPVLLLQYIEHDTHNYSTFIVNLVKNVKQHVVWMTCFSYDSIRNGNEVLTRYKISNNGLNYEFLWGQHNYVKAMFYIAAGYQRWESQTTNGLWYAERQYMQLASSYIVHGWLHWRYYLTVHCTGIGHSCSTSASRTFMTNNQIFEFILPIWNYIYYMVLLFNLKEM